MDLFLCYGGDAYPKMDLSGMYMNLGASPIVFSSYQPSRDCREGDV